MFRYETDSHFEVTDIPTPGAINTKYFRTPVQCNSNYPELTETANRPDMQKNRITGFENMLQWQFKVEKDFLQKAVFRLYIYLRTNKTSVHNSLHVFDNSEKI